MSFLIYSLSLKVCSLGLITILLLPNLSLTNHLETGSIKYCSPETSYSCGDSRAECVPSPQRGNYFCKCTEGYKYDANTFQCIELKQYGESCYDNRECSYFDPNTTCYAISPRGQVCVCRSELWLEFNKVTQTCVPCPKSSCKVYEYTDYRITMIVISVFVLCVVMCIFSIRKAVRYCCSRQQSNSLNGPPNGINTKSTFGQPPSQSVNHHNPKV